MVVVGEASFMTPAARFIDDNAPDSQIADFLEEGTDLFRKLPPDIFRKIMRNLSLECVIGCKFVCKSWRNQIEKGVFRLEEKIAIMKIRTLVMINAAMDKIHAVLEGKAARGESEFLSFENEIKKWPVSPVVRGSTIVVIAIAVGCFIFGVRKRSM